MTELEYILEAVVNGLSSAGTGNVIRAYPPGVTAAYTEPVTAVGLKSGSGVSVGLAEYMGMEYDSVSDSFREVYGKKVELSISLDIYSPRDDVYGAAACTAVFGRIMTAAMSRPSGIKILEMSCGETVYDSVSRMFRCQGELRCAVALYMAKSDEGADFTSFKIKGELEN